MAAPRPPDAPPVARRLLAWYDEHRRDLPWRRTRDPWAILVSELMLQQTRVETGLRRYPAFLARFPTPRAAATASERDVLRAWAGLGYYRRARSLRAAAQRILAEHGGEVPRTAAALATLPGVGPYTAGAVASIAYGQRTPCVDGNVARVVARLTARRGDATTPAARRDAHAYLEPRIPARAGDFNQALMELGALVCVPHEPRCDVCPLARSCVARRRGLQHRIAAPRRTAPVPVDRVVALVVRAGDRVWLERNPPGGLLADQWSVPILPARRGRSFRRAVEAWLRDRGAPGGEPPTVVRLGPFHHAFSHRVWRGAAYELRWPQRPPPLRAPDAGGRWIGRASVPRMVTTTPTRRLLVPGPGAATF